MQHEAYSQIINIDQATPESAMSLQSLFQRIAGFRLEAATAMSYEDIFKGKASVPPGTAGSSNDFMPGLRPLEYDVDAYFKEVFAGPVF